jgi:Cys-rich repeat protein
MSLSRRLSCAVAIFLAACQSATPMQFARPNKPSTSQMQALNGTGYQTNATFSAPVVDPNTWQGTPIGTGSWTAQSTPAQSGGNQAIGAVDSSSTPGSTYSYVVIGDFTSSTSHFFAVISDTPFVVGATQVDNQHVFAGIFDATTGNPTALADSGTVTFTQVGGIGGNVAGSFSGTLEDAPAQSGTCRTNADCAANQSCTNGVCVPNVNTCTSNAQCPAGTTCQNGACIATSSGCTSNAQCPSGTTCQAGACVGTTPACTTDADCAAGNTCQRGVCIPSSSGCTSNAQCPPGTACQGGACVGSSGGSCSAQGSGAYSGSATVPNTCSALGNGAVSLTNGVAFIGNDPNGGSSNSLYVFDPAGSPNGVMLSLNACPSAPGAVQTTGQVYVTGPTTGGVSIIALYDASGTINFTTVGHYTGSFSLTLTAGGTVSGTFDAQ